MDDVEDELVFVPALESIGLGLRGAESNHRMLRTTRPRLPPGTSTSRSRPEVAAYLDLRDWLRVDAADRRLYADTKRWLAMREWDDMNAYADAKSDVIRTILGRARAWRGGATP